MLKISRVCLIVTGDFCLTVAKVRTFFNSHNTFQPSYQVKFLHPLYLQGFREGEYVEGKGVTATTLFFFIVFL